ncbi:MAG: putative rane protein [Deltaproteobacteria bacterium]|nr:putative rane protein [Deltaproteobacteria bacterium]
MRRLLQGSPGFVGPLQVIFKETILRRLSSLIFCGLVAFCCVTQIVSVSKAASEGSKKEWRRVGETVIRDGDTPTKVTVVGNSVLVPVTLVYQGKQADVQLLLDTGASATVINTEIADRLDMNLRSARKIQLRVVGGQVIEAHVVMLDDLTVGPHTKSNSRIAVIQHAGPRVGYDGLLGMDVLRGIKYKVDIDKQLILWE